MRRRLILALVAALAIAGSASADDAPGRRDRDAPPASVREGLLGERWRSLTAEQRARARERWESATPEQRRRLWRRQPHYRSIGCSGPAWPLRRQE